MTPVRLRSRLALCTCVGLLACGGEADGDGGSEGATGMTTSTSTSPSPTTTSAGQTTGDETTSTSTGTGSGSADATEGDSTGSSTDTGEAELGDIYLYVASGDTVQVWSVDKDTGALSDRNDVLVNGRAGPLAVDPAGEHLYVSLLDEQSVSAYAIDPASGDLTFINTVEVDLSPVYITVDHTDRALLTADFGANTVAVYPLEASGVVGGAPSDMRVVGARPHSVVLDASNEHVFVPHRDSNYVEQYLFDAQMGTLTPNDPPAAEAPSGAGPRHMVFHPDGTHAFVVNEFTDSVTVYAYTQETGLLAAQETVSTIPTEFPGDDNTCADVHVTPDGAFLYASNRGHDSLAMFAIDSRTKALTSLGQVPTEPRPREFEVDPLGRFVYAAGQDSGQLASYAIEDDGTLTALEVYAAEPQPLWVLAVGIPEKP